MGRKIIYCEDTGEECQNYSQYLKSKHWALVKIKFLNSANRKCSKCGKVHKAFHVHHKHYDTLGKENMWDLKLMCEKCHQFHHRKIFTPGTVKTNNNNFLSGDQYDRDNVDSYLTSLDV